MEQLRVAVVQMEHVSGDKRANWEKIERMAGEAAKRGVQMLAFPECCITGYWFLRKLSREQLWDVAEHVPGGESCRRLLELAKRLRMTVGAGLVERGEGGAMHNTYMVALPDGTMHRHRKIHAFEHDAIGPGDQYTVFDTPYGWRIGVLICYDNNIVENVRMTALLGADLLLSPHQTGGCNSISPCGMKPVDQEIWRNRAANPGALRAEFMGDKGREWIMRWLPSRAHDNGLFLMFANGVGQDDDEVRTGNAMILDPYGRTITESSSIDDDLVVANLDPALLENCTGRRWMRVRRPELYAKLAEKTGKERSTRAVRFGKDD